ncbi:hypothetical protein P8C59_000874 [Phyllachora maydis]|uniref:Uncharacterized protein n=1 Tax=Phyllachora maydis TaxID=1825666 RepID=A0AAD9M8A6_9PEZI|nr:hypothetical protein P8C59_000874 [Phyllachora maydis]
MKSGSGLVAGRKARASNDGTMCIRRIYYNTYGDGTKDVTERVVACRPGRVCSLPEVWKYKRTFRFTKLRDPSTAVHGSSPSSLVDRKPTPYSMDGHHHYDVLPPTPRTSKSPSPDRHGSAAAAAIYIHGVKTGDLHRSSSRHHRDHYPRRASTLDPDHGPILYHDTGRLAQRRSHSRDMALGPVTLGRRSSRDPTPTSIRRSHHDRYDGSSPRRPRRYENPDVVYGDDEWRRGRETRERERATRHEEVGEGGVVYGGAGYVMPHAPDGPKSEYASVPTTPRKTLRWQDQVDVEKAAQNARIARRPKYQTGKHGVKGILKKQADEQQYDELRRAVHSMDINDGGGGETQRGRDRAPRAADAYWDRLRGRFGAEEGGEADGHGGRERKRRSKVSYSGEGLYKYS